MKGILRIKNKYWLVADCDELDVVKSRFRTSLRQDSKTSETFITSLNKLAGYPWIERELDVTNTQDHSLIYGPDSKYLWFITLTARRIEFKQKKLSVTNRKCMWAPVSNVVISSR